MARSADDRIALNGPQPGTPAYDEAAALIAQAELPPSQQKKAAMAKTYTIQHGDSLYDIAKQMTGDGNNWRMIAKLNKITSPKHIQPGMVLKLAPGAVPIPRLRPSAAMAPSFNMAASPPQAMGVAPMPAPAPSGPDFSMATDPMPRNMGDTNLFRQAGVNAMQHGDQLNWNSNPTSGEDAYYLDQRDAAKRAAMLIGPTGGGRGAPVPAPPVNQPPAELTAAMGDPQRMAKAAAMVRMLMMGQ